MANSPKNILFISYDGMTDPLGQSQVIPYLQGLSKHRFNIFLLSCEKTAAFSKNKGLVEELLKGYSIQWIPLSYTKNPPALSTWFDIKKLKNAAAQIHREHGIDLVHTRPGVPALVGLWLKKKFGMKFLNDIREFYADSRVEGGMWKLKNPVFKKIYDYFKRKEAEGVEQSDGIVCLTWTAEKIIRQWPEYQQGTPLAVIPCSVDLNLFDPLMSDENKTAEIKRELNIGESDIVVTYLGSIGGWYLIEEMMHFCKLLSDKKSTAKFLFISPHRHEAIVAAATTYGVDPSKVITKKASRPEVPQLLALSDYSVFFIRPCYSKLSSSPTKHGEIMAMGIPLITNSGVGDVKDIVQRHHSGVVLNDFTEASFAMAVDRIVSGESFDREGIRLGAEACYSLETAVEDYSKMYMKILEIVV